MKQRRELFFSIIFADGGEDGCEEVDPDKVEEIVAKVLEEKYGDDFIGVQYNDEEWGELC